MDVSAQQLTSSKFSRIKNSAYRRIGRSNPFLRYGIPLISFTVFGAFGLGHLKQIRKDVSEARDEREWEVIEATMALTREGPIKDNKMTKKLDLEAELKAIQEKVNINDFDYKPVPRPRES